MHACAQQKQYDNGSAPIPDVLFYLDGIVVLILMTSLEWIA
jgi:hypothetical protein